MTTVRKEERATKGHMDFLTKILKSKVDATAHKLDVDVAHSKWDTRYKIQLTKEQKDKIRDDIENRINILPQFDELSKLEKVVDKHCNEIVDHFKDIEQPVNTDRMARRSRSTMAFNVDGWKSTLTSTLYTHKLSEEQANLNRTVPKRLRAVHDSIEGRMSEAYLRGYKSHLDNTSKEISEEIDQVGKECADALGIIWKNGSGEGPDRPEPPIPGI